MQRWVQRSRRMSEIAQGKYDSMGTKYESWPLTLPHLALLCSGQDTPLLTMRDECHPE